MVTHTPPPQSVASPSPAAAAAPPGRSDLEPAFSAHSKFTPQGPRGCDCWPKCQVTTKITAGPHQAGVQAKRRRGKVRKREPGEEKQTFESVSKRNWALQNVL